MTHAFYADPGRSQSNPRTGLPILLIIALLTGGLHDGLAANPDDPTGERGVDPEPTTTYPEYADRWAVIVGISDYADDRLDLDYAHRDADALYELLLAPAGGGFDPEHIVRLTNENATKRNIERALRTFLKKPAREDVVYLFFAAHGTPDPDRPNNVYLLTHDTNYDDISGTAMPMREIQASLADNLLAERVVLLADTCHSGSIGAPEGGRSGIDSAAAVNRYLEELSSTRGGIALLTSAESGEVAREHSRWGGGHGVFTHYLLEGMRKEADTAPEDGVVTVGELFEYVRDNVRKATSNQQHPSIGQTSFDRRLPITIIGGVTAQELYRIGLGLYEAGRLEDDVEVLRFAADQLSEAVRLAGRDSEVYGDAELARGQVLLSSGEYDEAVHALRNAAKIDGSVGTEAEYYLGFAHALNGDQDKSRQALHGFVEDAPADPRSGWVTDYLNLPEQQDDSSRYALLIGIERYADSAVMNLAGPGNDLGLLRRILTERLGFPAQNIIVLRNEDATRANILGALSDLAQRAGDSDSVIIHYSGHSMPDTDQSESRTFLLPFDYIRADDRHGITSRELDGALSRIATKDVTIVADTHMRQELIDLAHAANHYNLIGAAHPTEMAYEVQEAGVVYGKLSFALGAVLLNGASDLTYRQLQTALDGRLDGTRGLAVSVVSPPQDRPERPFVVIDESAPAFGGGTTVSPVDTAFRVSSRRNWATASAGDVLDYGKRLLAVSEAQLPEASYSLARALLSKGDPAGALRFVSDEAGSKAWLRLEALLVKATAEAGAGRLTDMKQTMSVAAETARANGANPDFVSKLEGQSNRKARAALLVGIDKYKNKTVGDLDGARNDLQIMRRMLIEDFGFAEHEIVTLADKQATRDAILREFSSLVAADPIVGVFYFAGRGSNQQSLSNRGFDVGTGALIPTDGRTPGVDDILISELATSAGNSGINLVSIFDNAWSAGFNRGLAPDRRERSSPRGLAPPTRQTDFSPGVTFGSATLWFAANTGEPFESDKVDPWSPEDRRAYGVIAHSIASTLKSQSLDASTYRGLVTSLTQQDILAGNMILAADENQGLFAPSPQIADKLWRTFEPELLESRRIGSAVAALQRKINQRNGQYAQGWLQIGIAYAAIGEFSKSVRALEKAIVQNEGTIRHNAQFNLGRVLSTSGEDHERAVSELREVLNDDPANSRARFYLARSIQALVEGDLVSEAEDEYRQYLRDGAPLGHVEEVREFLYRREADANSR